MAKEVFTNKEEAIKFSKEVKGKIHSDNVNNIHTVTYQKKYVREEKGDPVLSPEEQWREEIIVEENEKYLIEYWNI